MRLWSGCRPACARTCSLHSAIMKSQLARLGLMRSVPARSSWRWAVLAAITAAVVFKFRILPAVLQLIVNVFGIVTGKVKIVSIAGRWTLTQS